MRNRQIREEQDVVKDQGLVKLETMCSGSSYAEMLEQVNALTANKARLLAEINGTKEITFDTFFSESNPQLVQRTNALFQIRRRQLERVLQAQRDEVSICEQVIQKMATRILFSQKRLLLVQEQNEIERFDLTSSSNSHYDHLNNFNEMNKLESDISENAANLAKSKVSLNQARSNLVTIQNKYTEDLNIAYSKTCGLLEHKVQRLKKYKGSLERTVLSAPMNGIIKNLDVITREGIVTPDRGDMAPRKDSVMIEVKLLPQDSDHVQQGQSVFIQLSSGEAHKYGRLMGEVVSINPDIITTEKEAYYIMRSMVDTSCFSKGQNRYKLSTGVLVSVGIITGKHSMLAYILSLFVRSLPFSPTER